MHCLLLVPFPLLAAKDRAGAELLCLGLLLGPLSEHFLCLMGCGMHVYARYPHIDNVPYIVTMAFKIHSRLAQGFPLSMGITQLARRMGSLQGWALPGRGGDTFPLRTVAQFELMER